MICAKLLNCPILHDERRGKLNAYFYLKIFILMRGKAESTYLGFGAEDLKIVGLYITVHEWSRLR